VSADRKGPLVAFIVVAIIAAILLVTSVRSQAATGWFRRALPSTHAVVHVVDGGLDRAVHQGSALVRATTDQDSTTTALPSDAPSPQPSSRAASRPSHPTATPPAPHAVRHEVTGGVSTSGSPGRHLGWTHAGHPHAVHAVHPGHPVHPDHADRPDRPDHPDHPDHPEHPVHDAPERR
jgi:hypothetical protein